MRLAVVGSGVAGLACAHLLGPHHDVVLFEADRRLGGHANTVDVDDPAAGPLAIDTGFIVHNDRNYPHFQRLLADLGVSAIDSEMSFAVTDRATGFCYRATNLDTLLASRANALDPRLWRMVADIIRFQRAGRRFLASDVTGFVLGAPIGAELAERFGVAAAFTCFACAIVAETPGAFGVASSALSGL